jgi:hypothetical protein
MGMVTDVTIKVLQIRVAFRTNCATRQGHQPRTERL